MSTSQQDMGLADGLIDGVSKLKLSDGTEFDGASDAQPQQRRRRARPKKKLTGLPVEEDLGTTQLL
jgi:hypothetical protein